MTKKIPVLRAYFMLRAKRGSTVEVLLSKADFDLDDFAPTITQRKFQGKGSSHHPPFGAVEIGFELFDYDLSEAESNVARAMPMVFSDAGAPRSENSGTTVET